MEAVSAALAILLRPQSSMILLGGLVVMLCVRAALYTQAPVPVGMRWSGMVAGALAGLLQIGVGIGWIHY